MTTAPLPPVVLLHGLARTPRSMRRLATALAARGRQVYNVGYPSRRHGVSALAAIVARDLAAVTPGERLDFVTHSLGGILVRALVAEGALPADRVGRVVMIAPPNGGSEIPDFLMERPLLRLIFRRLMGPSGPELGTAPTCLVRRLPPVEFELGIIAGGRSVNPLFARVLPAPHDGTVSVERTIVDGARAHIVVSHSHPFIMRAPCVIANCLAFLESGSFNHP